MVTRRYNRLWQRLLTAALVCVVVGSVAPPAQSEAPSQATLEVADTSSPKEARWNGYGAQRPTSDPIKATAQWADQPPALSTDQSLVVSGTLAESDVAAARAEFTATGAEAIRIIVATQPQARLADVAQQAELDQSVIRELPNLSMVVVEVTAGELESLADNPNVVAIELDDLSEPHLTASTETVGADYMQSFGWIGNAVPGGQPGAEVAIIDTGVDTSHPAFGGRLVAEVCFSLGGNGQPGAGDCPNGLDADLSAGAGQACGFGPDSGCDHGTHVAGIATGQAVPGIVDAGVAPGAGVIAAQVFSNFSGTALSWRSDQLAALDWIIGLVEAGRPIAAVNLSLGGGRFTSAAECDQANPARLVAFNRLEELGVAVVASAGNNGWTDAISAPACVGGAISVGAVAGPQQPACYTNSSSLLDVWAPGGSLCPADEGDPITSAVPGGGSGQKSGTSMSAPHVAGAIAVLGQCGSATAAPGWVEAALGASTATVTRAGETAPLLDLRAAARYLVGNDDVATAQTLAVGVGQIETAGSTTCATSEDGEPFDTSVWYSIQAPSTGLLRLTTNDQTVNKTYFDTQLELFKGPPSAIRFDELNPVAFDDDGGAGQRSRIIAPLNGGDWYYLKVGGTGVAHGHFALSASLTQLFCGGVAATHVADLPTVVIADNAGVVVVGTQQANVIETGDGDDIICSGSGDDTVRSGRGNDLVIAGQGNDILEGGVGTDRLVGNQGDDQLFGEAGDDILQGGHGVDRLFGGDGDDKITTGSGDDYASGGRGDDRMSGGSGDDELFGGNGNDQLLGHGGDDMLSGGSDDDNMRGGTGNDTMLGLSGNDQMFGQPGDDNMVGGLGNDIMFGWTGNDTMAGETGDDQLFGQAGDDMLSGGAGVDVLAGAQGIDSLDGGPASPDLCNGGAGVDINLGGCEVTFSLR